MTDSLKLRSKIKSDLVRTALFRGSSLAITGALLIVYAGFALPVSVLSLWGFLWYGVGMTLIAVGLIPYKRLTSLQIQPDELVVEANLIRYRSKNTPLFALNLNSIAEIGYIDDPKGYGIGVSLKRPPPEKIRVLSHRIDMNKIQKDAREKQGYDLFFPYFNERTYKDLIEVLAGECD